MSSSDKEFSRKLEMADKLAEEGQITKNINQVEHLIKLAKETLTYYRRSQTNRFLFCLLLMWIGWITFLFIDLSGIPRQATLSGWCTVLADMTLVAVIIPLVLEYFGNVLFQS